MLGKYIYSSKRKIKKILTTLVFLPFLIFVSSCSDIGETIADVIIDEFDPSKNDPTPDGDNGPNEDVLYEEVLIEDLLKENLLTEEILEENIIEEIITDEQLSSEEIILENVRVEIYDDLSKMEDDFCCESYYTIDNDYAFIKQRIAEGVNIVLSEIIFDFGQMVYHLVTLNFGSMLLDAGQIVVMAGGTTLAAYIRGLIAKADALEAGLSYEEAMYDALYYGSEAFYYTSALIDTAFVGINLGQSLYDASASLKQLKDKIKYVDAFVNIKNTAGKKIGEVLPNGQYKVNIDGYDKVCTHSTATNLDGKSIDLYDPKTNQYTCSLREGDDGLQAYERIIPDYIPYKRGDNVGKPKFIFEENEVYRATYTNNDSLVKTYIGTIDQGGFIKNDFGQYIGRIDLDTGKEVNGFTSLINTSDDIHYTTTPIGEVCEIVNENGIQYKPLSKANVDGKTCFLNYKGEPIFEETIGSDNVSYLRRYDADTSTGRVVGGFNSDGKFNFEWKVNLNYRRSSATSTVRKKLCDYVLNNDVTIIRRNFPSLDGDIIDYIKKNHKIPSNIQIHHCYNVANYPDLADDYRNLVVLTKDEHLMAHFGDFHNPTAERPSQWRDLTNILVFDERLAAILLKYFLPMKFNYC